MHASGQTTIWGTRIRDSLAIDDKGWYQQLRAWWTARTAVRQAAARAVMNACWNDTREVYTPMRADAAAEMALAHRALPLPTHPYSLI